MDKNKLNGAIQGAAAGSVLGPYGALIGGLVGAKKAGMTEYQNNLQQALTGQQSSLQNNEHNLQLDDDDLRYAQNFVDSDTGYGTYGGY